MNDDAKNATLVFNPRKLSVDLVEAELAKHPDLTIDQVKALLEQEGSQVRPRKGVERLLDARLVALAEGALEAAAKDMMEQEEEKAEPEPEQEPEEEKEVVRAVAAVLGKLAIVEPEEEQEAPAEEDETGVETALDDTLGRMTAEELAKFGLCRMMGPDPDDPMAAEGVDEGAEEVTLDNCGRLDPDEWVADWDGKEWHLRRRSVQAQMRDKGQPPKAVLALLDEQSAENDQSDVPDIAAGTPVHATLENGQEHEGYYVKPQTGAMIRLRDGKDTIVYAPDDRFFVSPREGGREGDGD